MHTLIDMVENTVCIFCGKPLDEANPQKFKSKVCPECWAETLLRNPSAVEPDEPILHAQVTKPVHGPDALNFAKSYFDELS